MCTVHVLESSVAVLKGTASGPGSIIPPIALPSHVMTSVTSWRACGVGPQSPYHVPTSGCPSCADAGASDRRNATANSRQALLRLARPEHVEGRARLGQVM